MMRPAAGFLLYTEAKNKMKTIDLKQTNKKNS